MNTLTHHHSRRSLAAWLTLALALAGLAVLTLIAPEPAYLRADGGAAGPSLASGGFSYSLSGYRWNKDTVTYSIANCPQSLDCETAQAAIVEAAAAWDAAANLNLAQVPENGDIVISWAASGYGGRHTFDGKGGKVAQTYYPYTGGGLWYDGDIVLDDAETWVAAAPTERFPNQVHLTSVVMHEMGHSLGLAHTSNRAALMWPYYSGVRGLAAHDIAGVQALYGAPPAAAATQ